MIPAATAAITAALGLLGYAAAHYRRALSDPTATIADTPQNHEGSTTR